MWLRSINKPWLNNLAIKKKMIRIDWLSRIWKHTHTNSKMWHWLRKCSFLKSLHQLKNYYINNYMRTDHWKFFFFFFNERHLPKINWNSIDLLKCNTFQGWHLNINPQFNNVLKLKRSFFTEVKQCSIEIKIPSVSKAFIEERF